MPTPPPQAQNDDEEVVAHQPESRSFACNCFYITVDTVDKVWEEEKKKHFLFGTSRADRGAQHCGIEKR